MLCEMCDVLVGGCVVEMSMKLREVLQQGLLLDENIINSIKTLCMLNRHLNMESRCEIEVLVC